MIIVHCTVAMCARASSTRTYTEHYYKLVTSFESKLGTKKAQRIECECERECTQWRHGYYCFRCEQTGRHTYTSNEMRTMNTAEICFGRSFVRSFICFDGHSLVCFSSVLCAQIQGTEAMPMPPYSIVSPIECHFFLASPHRHRYT